MRGTDQVSVCFFGDGALGQGLIYEVMNMASLWKLPIIYVCENNLYTEYTPYQQVLAGTIRGRPEAFGVYTLEVDGQDVGAVAAATGELVARCRRGEGPGFLICNTYRYYGHHVGDINRTYYRSKEEEAYWRTERDPITLLGDWLQAEGMVEAPLLEHIGQQVDASIKAAVAFAIDAPYPDRSEVDQHVYA
jgi:pyruvate dehydrogenase E1 component alpha subunit